MKGNAEMLANFTKYCVAHPGERFFQALRNWSGYVFIYGQKEGDWVSHAFDEKGQEVTLEDTFYKE